MIFELYGETVNLTWYFNRLKKMSFEELQKRFLVLLKSFYGQIKYRNIAEWPYSRFAGKYTIMYGIHNMSEFCVQDDWEHYPVYNFEFDLTKPVEWFFTEKNDVKWPTCHYSKINYRPGNPYGDVRINWELNRLQFLPAMVIKNESLAKKIIADWLEKNPYVHGPGYISAMEVALRWISIYRAICLMKEPLDKSLIKNLTGLAVASGEYIKIHLSTHSSAGNHLIVEAVGLFWIGKSFEKDREGLKLQETARKILWEQIDRQLNPDGTNIEQSFWYLGFVLDALFHYFLLEDIKLIPNPVCKRVEKAVSFIRDITLTNGYFPDYGDRDDGMVSRPYSICEASPFNRLLNTAASFFHRPEWCIDYHDAGHSLDSWNDLSKTNHNTEPKIRNRSLFSDEPTLKTYCHGGMSLMKWGKGRVLFRHSPLGSGRNCAHGHADALSVLFSWGNNPVLIDLGSGQYNGDQDIRNFFRSTIAHNTVEIGGKSQSRILGPFMWDQFYETTLKEVGETPILHAEAGHNGYMKTFSVLHTRRVEWPSHHQIEILDSFKGRKGLPLRGAFHLGKCEAVRRKGHIIEADFDDFIFSLTFPAEFSLEIFYGSEDPFMGWRSTVYGQWEPIHAIIYSTELKENLQYKIILKIEENKKNV